MGTHGCFPSGNPIQIEPKNLIPFDHLILSFGPKSSYPTPEPP